MNNKINTTTSKTTNFSIATQSNSTNNINNQNKTTINNKNIVVEEMNFSIETKKQEPLTIAKQVLNGEWGNGEDRKTRLKEAGYNPEEIQTLVNGILNGTITNNQPSTPVQQEPEIPKVEEKIEVEQKTNTQVEKLETNNKPTPEQEILKEKISKVKKIIENTSNKLKKTLDKISSLFKSLISPKSKKDDLKPTEKSKNNYDSLSDTKNDVTKLFSKKTTEGINGERIVFDKKRTYDDVIVYEKDGKIVKTITKEYVEIGDTKYYKDGTYSIYNCKSKSELVTKFYSSDGKLQKVQKKGMGEIQTEYYNEEGIIEKKESKFDGKTIITTYDKDGNILQKTENGKIKVEYKDGKIINYDSEGNIESEVETYEDKTITYNKKNNTKTINYENGVSEFYDSEGKIKSSTDKNGIKTEYTHLKNGEKVSFIRTNENGQAVLTYYYSNGKIKSQTVGEITGGAPGSDGVTNVPLVKGSTINYDLNGNASTTSPDGVTTGNGYKEYNRDYTCTPKIFEKLGTTPRFSQGINKIRENYDSSGNLINVTCTGKSNINNGNTKEITEVYYPNNTYSQLEKEYNTSGQLVGETYYLRDSSGKILNHYKK